jgi:hypothetical protein
MRPKVTSHYRAERREKMEFPKISEGQQFIFKLPAIHALMTGIDNIAFDEASEIEYRAAIHFQGISFYDIVRIEKTKIAAAKEPLRIAIDCLTKLIEKGDKVDEVLIAACKKALKQLV